MYALKVKTVCQTAGYGLPRVTLQHPMAPLGPSSISDHSIVVTDEITSIPDTLSKHEVIKAWRETINISWLGKDESDPSIRHSFSFSEIGTGRIVR